ncbi:HAD-IA family hydrolase [Alteromonas ponticola]|uniref:HAD-IA family hydrolase n=1 Tax=Alteromonas aquimaris TaxID=2998417 RepID=A0ABT3PBA9_9ALTE|nr:HAD-IA family hydrolase [Alteromonas aquimaris]MCW8109860.1 HAD-IA family hydrolase [Alteromonas aquimaris]
MKFYRPLKPVRALTFDLDDTLYDNGPIIRAAEAALNSHLKKHHPTAANLAPSDWKKIQADLISANPALASDMGQLRMQSLLTALSDELAEHALEDAAKACFDHFYDKRSDFEIEQQIHSCLAKLSQKVPLIAITNGNVNPEKIGIAGYFKHFFHANTDLPMKPAPALFKAAIDELDCQPEQILHVGDNLIKDVQGAINAGMQTAWYAHDRGMIMRKEKATLLPHVELQSLDDLLLLI